MGSYKGHIRTWDKSGGGRAISLQSTLAMARNSFALSVTGSFDQTTLVANFRKSPGHCSTGLERSTPVEASIAEPIQRAGHLPYFLT